MRDEILAAGSVFDWISPVLAIVGDIVNGPSYTFLIPYDCGRSGRDIISLLKNRGIKSWGHMVVQDTLMVTVRQQQAAWAQHTLDQAAIPVENPIATVPRAERSRGARRQAGTSQNSVSSAARDLWELELF